MNPHDHIGDDWQQLSTDWQQLPAPAFDFDSLQREADRRSRRVRTVAVAELLVAALAIGNCVRAMLDPRDLIPHGVLWGLIAFVAAIGAWLFRQRRRQWRSRGLAPAALVAFETWRARASLRIWRVSVWLALALWIGLVLLALAAMNAGQAAAPALPPQAWGLSIGLNALVVLISAGLGTWKGRGHRQQLARLRALDDALRAP